VTDITVVPVSPPPIVVVPVVADPMVVVTVGYGLQGQAGADALTDITIVPIAPTPIVVVPVGTDPIVVLLAGYGLQGPPGPPGNGSASEFVQPHFVYANGLLRRVEYADGRWKELEFLSGQLRWVDAFDGSQVLRRTLVRNAQGQLVDVVQSVLTQ
jgi:hypothetical protein